MARTRGFFPRCEDRLRHILVTSAGRLLRAGVTSARDVGAPLAESLWVRDEMAAGRIAGPRLFVSGPFLQKTRGPVQASFPWTVDGEDDARARVRENAEAGVDLIKVIQADRFSVAGMSNRSER